MSKFCSHCGSAMEDHATVCANCGAGVAAPQVEQPAPQVVEAIPVEAPAANQLPPVVNDVIGKVKAKPVLAAIPVAAIVAIILIIVLLSSLFSAGYTKPIDNLIDITFNGKFDNIEDMAPEAYWAYVEDEYDVDLDDMIDDAEDNYDELMEYYEEEYGSNIKVSYDVLDKKELSEKKVKKIASALKDQYDIDKDALTKVYELEVELEIKGSEDDDSSGTELIVAKIDGDWYLISYYEYDDEYRVSFMIDDL